MCGQGLLSYFGNKTLTGAPSPLLGLYEVVQLVRSITRMPATRANFLIAFLTPDVFTAHGRALDVNEVYILLLGHVFRPTAPTLELQNGLWNEQRFNL
jgi:hypothetical protein